MVQVNTVQNKYTNASKIYNRLVSKHKVKIFQEADIVEWCAECEINEIKTAPEWYLFKDIKLHVHNHQALQPCNIYRLLDIMDDKGQRINYSDNGTYIQLGLNTTYHHIFISYYGLPINEKGEPVIVKGHEKACEYYCIKVLYEEDFMTNIIDGQRWQYILSEYEDGLIKARSVMRNLSRNKIEEMMRIQYNMVQNVCDLPYSGLD